MAGNKIYEPLNNLKFGDSNTPIDSTNSGSPFQAPRSPKSNLYNTPLRALHCRPINTLDVTGRKVNQQSGNSQSNSCITDKPPQAFLHIISGEKDIYWPQRDAPNIGRLSNQIEYLKVGIDCVFRDEATPQPADNIIGNGDYWYNQICMGNELLPLPKGRNRSHAKFKSFSIFHQDRLSTFIS